VLRKKMDFPIDKRILRDKVAAPEKPGLEDGGEDLIIMGGYALGGLPPSQIWVKAALEQYFESRGMADHVSVFTGDEWYVETQEVLPRIVAVIQMDEHLGESIKSSDPDTIRFLEDSGAFINRLGVWPRTGMVPGAFYLYGRGS
jgi:hypothetical protein